MDAETFIRASLVLGFRYFRKIRSISHIRLTNSAINDCLRYRIHLIADFSLHSFERSTIQWDMLRAISNPLRDLAFLTEHRAVKICHHGLVLHVVQKLPRTGAITPSPIFFPLSYHRDAHVVNSSTDANAKTKEFLLFFSQINRFANERKMVHFFLFATAMTARVARTPRETAIYLFGVGLLLPLLRFGVETCVLWKRNFVEHIFIGSR